MPPSEEHPALSAIRAEMARRSWNNTDLAAAAQVSVDTVRDLTAGRRTPQPATLSKIERGFEWAAGTLANLADPGNASSSTMNVGAAKDDQIEILFHLPASAYQGVSEAGVEEAIATARAAALKALREIRGE